MSHTYDVEYTDTFGGDANYSWVRRATIVMPDMTHYGYDGSSNYGKISRIYDRELMRKAKAAVGLTGIRGTVDRYGDTTKFTPYKLCTALFIVYCQ